MRRIPLRVFIIAYLILIAVLSLYPGNDLPEVDVPNIDKLVHFFMYAGLGYLSSLSFGKCPLRWRQIRFWLFVLIFAYGYLMELLQGYIPALHRSMSYWDAFFNGLGALAGITLRLKSGYRNCRCKYSDVLRSSAGQVTATDEAVPPGGRILVSYNPCLPDIISKSFGWKHLLYSGKGYAIHFICTGKSLVSLPHFSYGNVRIPSHAMEKTLYDSLLSLTDKLAFASVEIRYPDDSYSGPMAKVASWMDITSDPWDMYSSNLRRKIRKAARNGFTVKRGGVELIDEFYKVYSRHMHTLGSGSLSKRWFRNLISDYEGGYIGVFLLIKDNKTVGAAINLEYQGFYENCWFAVLKPFQHLYGSYALYQAMIQHALELKADLFSFGRSTKNSGVHLFKKQWMAKDIPLVWIENPPPAVNVRKQDWLKKLWKMLPYPLGHKLGNYIAKWVY